MYQFVRVGWIAWAPEGFVSNAPHHLTSDAGSLIPPSTRSATTEQAGTNLTSQGTETHHLWWFSHHPPMLFRVHTLHSSGLARGLNASLLHTTTVIPPALFLALSHAGCDPVVCTLPDQQHPQMIPNIRRGGFPSTCKTLHTAPI